MFALVYAVSRFGDNWMLVSEVVSKSPAMGPWRSREQCAAQFRRLTNEDQNKITHAAQNERARSNREDARSVCHDVAAVKRFHELSRCVQKRVSDLGKQLSSSAKPTVEAKTHASHLAVLRAHLPTDKSAGIRAPDQIPVPTTSSRDRQDRVHPLKPVLSKPGSTPHSGLVAARTTLSAGQKRKVAPANGQAAKRQATVSILFAPFL